MSNIPDPIGKVVSDMAVLRNQVHGQLNKLPLTDPLRPILLQMNDVLGKADQDIKRVTQRATSQVGTTFRTATLPGIGTLHEMSTKLPGGGRITGIFG